MELVEALRADGIPAAISGAGPSVVAFALREPAGVADRMAELAAPGVRVEPLAVAAHGVRALA
jgi:homoserine kinase